MTRRTDNRGFARYNPIEASFRGCVASYAEEDPSAPYPRNSARQCQNGASLNFERTIRSSLDSPDHLSDLVEQLGCFNIWTHAFEQFLETHVQIGQLIDHLGIDRRPDLKSQPQSAKKRRRLHAAFVGSSSDCRQFEFVDVNPDSLRSLVTAPIVRVGISGFD